MDKYDEAIAYFTKYPEEIGEAWAVGHKHHCLFQMTCGHVCRMDDDEDEDECYPAQCGCLTMVRENNGYWKAPTDELTDEISRDQRIPRKREDIRVSDLPVFAEWQRRLDKELCRT